MLCTKCGEAIEGSPTWAVYADEAFEGKRLEAMPLHWTCFEEDQTVAVTEAHHVGVEAGTGAALYEHRERTITRYREVDGPVVPS